MIRFICILLAATPLGLALASYGAITREQYLLSFMIAVMAAMSLEGLAKALFWLSYLRGNNGNSDNTRGTQGVSQGSADDGRGAL